MRRVAAATPSSAVRTATGVVGAFAALRTAGAATCLLSRRAFSGPSTTPPRDGEQPPQDGARRHAVQDEAKRHDDGGHSDSCHEGQRPWKHPDDCGQHYDKQYWGDKHHWKHCGDKHDWKHRCTQDWQRRCRDHWSPRGFDFNKWKRYEHRDCSSSAVAVWVLALWYLGSTLYDSVYGPRDERATRNTEFFRAAGSMIGVYGICLCFSPLVATALVFFFFTRPHIHYDSDITAHVETTIVQPPQPSGKSPAATAEPTVTRQVRLSNVPDYIRQNSAVNLQFLGSYGKVLGSRIVQPAGALAAPLVDIPQDAVSVEVELNQAQYCPPQHGPDCRFGRRNTGNFFRSTLRLD